MLRPRSIDRRRRRSALTADSAGPGPERNGATSRAEPPEATTALCAPGGSRSRNSVAPLCTASSSSGAIPPEVSMTRTTDSRLEASGVTVVDTGSPPIVTDRSSADRSFPPMARPRSSRGPWRPRSRIRCGRPAPSGVRPKPRRMAARTPRAGRRRGGSAPRGRLPWCCRDEPGQTCPTPLHRRRPRRCRGSAR